MHTSDFSEGSLAAFYLFGGFPHFAVRPKAKKGSHTTVAKAPLLSERIGARPLRRRVVRQVGAPRTTLLFLKQTNAILRNSLTHCTLCCSFLTITLLKSITPFVDPFVSTYTYIGNHFDRCFMCAVL